MKRNILLGITGSVAAILLKKLYSQLSEEFNVKIVPTYSAITFFTGLGNIHKDNIIVEDERTYFEKTGKILHIELRNWAHALVIAPLTANTLAKISNGMADNLLTNIVRAWDTSKPIIIAPTMNCAMFNNPITSYQLDQVKKFYPVSIINPVVKTLKCGETGIGAMGRIEDIVDLTKNKLKWGKPLHKIRGIPINNHPGVFGYKRSYYYHTGVDLYCEDGDFVFAMEDGVITHRGKFTGPQLGHKHWEDTFYIAIKGSSGTIVYGEIAENAKQIGQKITKGEFIGRVKRVLPLEKFRPDIAGHSTSMLHLELYSNLPVDKEPISWHHENTRDVDLLDPTNYLREFEEKILE